MEYQYRNVTNIQIQPKLSAFVTFVASVCQCTSRLLILILGGVKHLQIVRNINADLYYKPVSVSYAPDNKHWRSSFTALTDWFV